MAAHLHKALCDSCSNLTKYRSFWKECVIGRVSSNSQLYLKRGNSSSVDTNPPKSDSSQEAQEVPNRTVVIDVSAEAASSTGNIRAARRFPYLIKSSEEDSATNLSFAALFRQSNFVHLGNAKGKVVVGKIFRVVGDDLYVDFDWKFPCVVKRPTHDAHLYVNNALVSLKILDLEMSTIFLGATKETSLNEANCALLSLIESPLGVPTPVKSDAMLS